MAWFLSRVAFTGGWNLAFIGLLPWLGEHAASLRLEETALSPFGLLPRLSPGPQLFLDTGKFFKPPRYRFPDLSRQMPNARVADDNGLEFPFVHYLGPEMRSEEALARYSIIIWKVRCNPVRLFSFPGCAWKAGRSQTRGRFGSLWGLWDAASSLTAGDILTLACFLATIAVFTIAVLHRDGAAIMGMAILSLYETITNYYCIRRLQLSWNIPRQRSERTVVVRTEMDAVWILKCDVLAFEALVTNYDRNTAPWESIYSARDSRSSWRAAIPTHPRLPVSLTRFGPVVLSLAYVLLANSGLVSQLAIATAYIVVTFLFYVVPSGDPNRTRFTFTRQYFAGTTDAHRAKPDLRASEVNPALARTLWYAIRITKTASWFDHILGPQPEQVSARWNRWLDEAVRNESNDDWPAEGEKRRLVDLDDTIYDVPEAKAEEQRDPSLEIRPVPVSQW